MRRIKGDSMDDDSRLVFSTSGRNTPLLDTPTQQRDPYGRPRLERIFLPGGIGMRL